MLLAFASRWIDDTQFDGTEGPATVNEKGTMPVDKRWGYATAERPVGAEMSSISRLHRLDGPRFTRKSQFIGSLRQVSSRIKTFR